MKLDFVIIGATGDQGMIASKDLLDSGYAVLLCGRNKDRLKELLKYKNANFVYLDATNIKEIVNVIKNSGSKIILNCAELKLNINIMKACLITNTNYFDLGGLQETTIKQYELSNDFKNKNLIALLGCGSTPGISNVMAKHAAEQLDNIKHIDLGFCWDSNIKEFVIPYSIESIVYELTTLPVALESGKFKKSNICYYEPITKLKNVGKQYIYCIVHSEVYTFAKYFKNKGLQGVHYTAGFPEHSHNALKFLIDLGFGSNNNIKIGNQDIKIIDFTREVLRMKKHPKNYKEIENVWVKSMGRVNGKQKTILMECITESLKGYEFAGSNINTGMTISILGQLFYKSKIKGIGVTAPEACVPCDDFFTELSKRKIIIYQDGTKIN